LFILIYVVFSLNYCFAAVVLIATNKAEYINGNESALFLACSRLLNFSYHMYFYITFWSVLRPKTCR